MFVLKNTNAPPPIPPTEESARFVASVPSPLHCAIYRFRQSDCELQLLRFVYASLSTVGRVQECLHVLPSRSSNVSGMFSSCPRLLCCRNVAHMPRASATPLLATLGPHSCVLPTSLSTGLNSNRTLHSYQQQSSSCVCTLRAPQFQELLQQFISRGWCLSCHVCALVSMMVRTRCGNSPPCHILHSGCVCVGGGGSPSGCVGCMHVFGTLWAPHSLGCFLVASILWPFLFCAST